MELGVRSGVLFQMARAHSSLSKAPAGGTPALRSWVSQYACAGYPAAAAYCLYAISTESSYAWLT